MKRFALSVALLLAVSAGSSVQSAQASASVIAAGPLGSAVGFLTPAAVASAAVPLTFVNGDVGAQHNVQSVEFGPNTNAWCSGFPLGRCPLFFSKLVGAGGTSVVEGLGKVKTATPYAFVCQLHGAMKGTLVVI